MEENRPSGFLPMKRLAFVWCVWLLACAAGYPSGAPGYYFYTPDEIGRMQRAARTEWGAEIVARLQRTVNERLRYPMEVPLLEGGHAHDYFCPVHNTPFEFDWYSPRAHYCRACGAYRSGVERYDWAWVNEVHNANREFLTANAYLFLITGERTYARHIARLLLDYAGKYPGYVEHNRERELTSAYSGRMFAQSLDEAVWATEAARAYVAAAPAMTPGERQAVETGYLQVCARMLADRYDKGNWQAWHNSALAALGVALQNDSIIGTALYEPANGYEAVLNRNVYPDGWWNEGSAVYHFYPLRALLLTAEAVRCRGTDLYDARLYAMCRAPVDFVYADLTFPSQNDGWYGLSLAAQGGLYELASLRYGDPLFREVLGACYRYAGRRAPEALLNGEPVPAGGALTFRSHVFPNLGTALLRSGNRTVTLKFGPDGGIHGHPDKLALCIHNGREEVLPDLGTPAYGVPDCREWYRRTFAHSTVTVDGRDQHPATGSLLSFRPEPDGGEVSAQVTGAYPGVTLRRTAALHGNRITDRFVCASDTLHTYDYILLLPGDVLPGGTPDSTTAAAYTRLQQVKTQEAEGAFRFDMPQASVTVRVKPARRFRVISGSAPGIPPAGGRPGRLVYPLIIRTEGKTAEIEAVWLLRDP